MKKTGRETVILTISIVLAVMLVGGCEEGDVSNAKKSKLIAYENRQLKEQLAQREKKIEEQLAQRGKKTEEQSRLQDESQQHP